MFYSFFEILVMCKTFYIMNTICIKTDNKIDYFTFCENISVCENLTFFTLEYDKKNTPDREINDICNSFLDYTKSKVFYKFDIQRKNETIIFRISVYTKYISFITEN